MEVIERDAAVANEMAADLQAILNMMIDEVRLLHRAARLKGELIRRSGGVRISSPTSA